MLAKVGFDFDPKTSTIQNVVLPLIDPTRTTLYGNMLVYGLHAAFIVLMLCANVLMLRFYVLSMQENGAAKATVQNFAVNYLSSILFGWLFFAELITIKLLLGVCLILAGTLVIATCQEDWQPT